MKAKELRIGNYVHHTDNWSYRQPEQDFKDFDFKWDNSDFNAMLECTLNIEDIEPIPLTEEWLLKFGYEVTFVDFKHFYKLKDLYLDDKFQPCDTFISYDLQYVHQLQNLYFALTQKELNYEI